MKKCPILIAMLLSILLLISMGVFLHAADGTRIRIGTAAPKDSLWHEVLKELKQEWERSSNKEIVVQIFEGQKLGDEKEMVDQVRGGQIQSVALTTVGLSQIDNALACLQIPFMIKSYEELDYVLEHIGPKLEAKLEQKGFKLLLWADAGWIRTFTKEPVHTPDELKKMNLWTSAGDGNTEKLYKDLGFHVTPLSLSDMIPSLQTNMINATNLPPYYVSMMGAQRIVPYMTGIRWNPLVAGTVIDIGVWNSIDEKVRTKLLATAQNIGAKYRDRIRNFGEDSIKEMQKKGLKVVELTPAQAEAWQKEAEKAYPEIRGTMTPAEYFDEVQKLVGEYRKSKN